MILKSISALGKKNPKDGIHEPEIDVDDPEEPEFYAMMPEFTTCRLIVEPNNEIVAASFMVNTRATIVHGMNLGNDHVRVSIKEVFNKNAVLPILIPSADIFLVMSAIDTLVSWPKYLVYLEMMR
ncbi:hypothetical protein PanWU01x14_043640 [Parasponia andersonii]|uniref:DUF8039 domain-containing protein n=1 Tax=Parasponia andersonii TaxID=3476 RepID=A0A2P5DQ36_PARAD|nr:hypothetical protein PanWU01x14_043640 [Parasponia andersonii]